MTADFRNLIFLNYRVERQLLEPRLPSGVDLELIHGHAYISLVAFLFENLHVQGFPAPFHQHFEEVNLRFYVKQAEKHGVVFIREIVPKTLLAAAARLIFQEKYISLPMEHSFTPGENQIDSIEYRWTTEHQNNFVRARFKNEWQQPGSNSLEYLFMKRHYGFTAIDKNETRQICMEHPDWRIAPVIDAQLECDIAELFGIEFVPYLTLKPASAFVAEGSPVKFFASNH